MPKRKLLKKLFSILFLLIFFAKMVITLAPLIVNQFDRDTMNAVIMQLEIENNAKGSDTSKELLKDYIYTISSSNFTSLLQNLIKNPTAASDANHRCTFFPSVPTPPPNV